MKRENAQQLFFAAMARPGEFAIEDEFIRPIEKVKYGGGTFCSPLTRPGKQEK